MTYPFDFTGPQDVFGDLINMAVFPVVNVAQESGEWRFTVNFGDAPDVNPNTPLVYTYPAANGDYEIVKVVSCVRASGYIVVERGQEGTNILGFAANGTLVQEPTAATYTALKNLLLLTQKYAGLMGTVLPELCEPGNFFFHTGTGAFYACFTEDVWTRLDQADHGAFTGLGDANAHTIYKTLAQASLWHDAMVKLHLTDAGAHDHSDSFTGAGKPVRKLKSGNLADRPAPQNSGDVYIAQDTRSLFVSSDGLTWETYSTVPRGTTLMFEGACPSGWVRVTGFDNKMPRGAGAGVWTGLGSGGITTHQHDLSTLISHAHTVAAIDVLSSSNGAHTHNVRSWSGSGSSTVPVAPDDASSTTSIASGSNGGHSHGVTLPGATTGAVGFASPKTDVIDGRPPYQTLLFCRKQ